MKRVTLTELAVKIYLDVGFEPYKLEDTYLGWQIIKKITNHTKLSNINEIEYTDIYNSLNALIAKFYNLTDLEYRYIADKYTIIH